MYACQAWLPYLIPSFGNYSVLRAFRALRPLRALKRVPGMPTLVQSILSALPRVGNVVMLCAFVFLVFAIVGVESFKGQLHYRCALPGFVEAPGHPTILAEFTRRLQALPPGGGGGGGGSSVVVGSSSGGGSGGGSSSIGVDSSSSSRAIALLGAAPAAFASAVARRALKGGGASAASGEQAAWDTGAACNPLAAADACAERGDGSACGYFEANPASGLMSFDNVYQAMIPLLQAITFDDWTEVMYALMTSLGSSLVCVYFLAIVVLGGFFIVNLFLAVIFEETIQVRAASARA